MIASANMQVPTALTMRDKVNAIEAEMKQVPKGAILNVVPIEDADIIANIELKTEHFFSPGIYTRVLHIPKGCLLTGKIHNEPILNIMIKGDISVLIGDEVKRIVAPYYVVSPAGSKKIGYAHEDTIWIGCHGTDEVDITKIEKRFVSASEQEFLEYCGQLRLPQCG